MRGYSRLTAAATAAALLAVAVTGCSGSSDGSAADTIATIAPDTTTTTEPAQDATTTVAETTTSTIPAGELAQASVASMSPAYPGTIDIELSRTSECEPVATNAVSIGIPQCMQVVLTARDAPYGIPLRGSTDGQTLSIGDDRKAGLRIEVAAPDPNELTGRSSWWPGTLEGGTIYLDGGGETILQDGEPFVLSASTTRAPDDEIYQFAIGDEYQPTDPLTYDLVTHGVVVTYWADAEDPDAPATSKAVAAISFDGDGGEALRAAVQVSLDQGPS